MVEITANLVFNTVFEPCAGDGTGPVIGPTGQLSVSSTIQYDFDLKKVFALLWKKKFTYPPSNS